MPVLSNSGNEVVVVLGCFYYMYFIFSACTKATVRACLSLVCLVQRPCVFLYCITASLLLGRLQARRAHIQDSARPGASTAVSVRWMPVSDGGHWSPSFQHVHTCCVEDQNSSGWQVLGVEHAGSFVAFGGCFGHLLKVELHSFIHSLDHLTGDGSLCPPYYSITCCVPCGISGESCVDFQLLHPRMARPATWTFSLRLVVGAVTSSCLDSQNYSTLD